MKNNATEWYSPEDGMIMVLINISVITLGTIGIILNGFSLHVLWKCMTTGQLGIKLMLLSDLLVCIAYVAFNIQSNIVNSLSPSRNDTYTVKLATINRLFVHVSLYVSNWWIIALLLLRILTIFSSVNAKSWDKMLYHRLLYLICCVTGVVIIISLRHYERYTRLIIYVVPVILVSIEAALIIYGIRRVQHPHASITKKSLGSSYQDIPGSSSNSSTHTKARQMNFQTIKPPRPYNNIVFTILLLALNFLVLDSLLFIDTLHAISKYRSAPLPTWFMLLNNIFSLTKRILNFVILCAKCRHFRKIMTLKLSMISRHLHRRGNMKNRKLSNPAFQDRFKDFSHCADCQRPVLFAMDNDFVSKTNLIERLLENGPLPTKGQAMFKIGDDSSLVNSYYSAFEMSPLKSQHHIRPILSARY